MTSLRFIRLTVALMAIFVLFINVYLSYAIVSGPTIQFSTVGMLFLSRHFLCLIAAYPIARYGYLGRRAFVLLFVVPSLILLHALIIWESKGMLELWPPILALDIALFLPSLLLLGLGKKRLKHEQDNSHP